MLAQGLYQIFRDFHGSRHFPRDQRLRLETLGWRVLDSNENPFSDDEVERNRETILLARLVKHDHEGVFTKYSLVDESGAADPNLPALARVSFPMEILQVGSRYELAERLWSPFMLTSSQIDIEVPWSRDRVLFSSGKENVVFPFSFRIYLVVFQSIILNDLFRRILRCAETG